MSPSRAASMAPLSDDSSHGCATAVGVGGIDLQRAISRSYFSCDGSITTLLPARASGPRPRTTVATVTPRQRPAMRPGRTNRAGSPHIVASRPPRSTRARLRFIPAAGAQPEAPAGAPPP